ncbi:MAG: hypothetical protein AAGF60_03735 [Pseudomonadota bacterium]
MDQVVEQMEARAQAERLGALVADLEGAAGRGHLAEVRRLAVRIEHLARGWAEDNGPDKPGRSFGAQVALIEAARAASARVRQQVETLRRRAEQDVQDSARRGVYSRVNAAGL